MPDLIKQSLAFCAGIICAVQILTLSPDVPPLPTYALGEFSTTTKSERPLTLKPAPTQGFLVRADQPATYSSIVFTGDTMLARHVEYLMKTVSHEYPFAGLDFNTFAPGAAVVTNFEASIPEVHVPTPALQVRFSVPTSYAETLAQSGVTHASLANNHSYDHGKTGYTHTVDTLKQAHINVFGHPTQIDDATVTYVQTDEETVAIIGLSTLHNTPAMDEIRELMHAVNRASDIQIVYIHWGGEYAATHNEHQEVVAEQLVANGADLIIGHHPHVVQDIQLVDNVPVLYSVGNYIFDQYFSTEVQTGLVAQYFSGPEAGITLNGISSLTQVSQPHLMNQLNQNKFLDALARKSDPRLQSAIREGFIPLTVVATSGKMAMID